jgi:hypothetical protein
MTTHTERRGGVVDTLASYLEGPVFKSRPGDWPYLLRFSWFSSVSPGKGWNTIIS